MYKRSLIPVNPYHVAAMEDWLNEMSAKGYQVVNIGRIYAKFRLEQNERNHYYCIPGEDEKRDGLTHVTDIDNKIQVYSSHTRINHTYQQQEEWRKLEKSNYMNLFGGLVVIVMGILLMQVRPQPSRSIIANLIIGNWEEAVILFAPLLCYMIIIPGNVILLRRQQKCIPREGTTQREEESRKARRRWKMKRSISVVFYTCLIATMISCLVNIKNDLGVALPTKNMDIPTISLDELEVIQDENIIINGETINICYRRYSFLAQKQYYINQINGRMNLKSWYVQTRTENLAALLAKKFATGYQKEDGYQLEIINSEKFDQIYYVRTNLAQAITMYQGKQVFLYVYEGAVNLREHLGLLEDKIEIFQTTGTLENYFDELDQN